MKNSASLNIFVFIMEKFNKIELKKTIFPNYKKFLGALFTALFLLSGCGGTLQSLKEPQLKQKIEILPRMGYSIQVGAFSIVDNAIKLSKSLQERDFDAYYFFDDTKLYYKVRFGNYVSLEKAKNTAENLRLKGIISEYIIIKPEDYLRVADTIKLRKELVLTAKTFLGVPYSWGGISYKTGFDCSGLTMAVYKLNGLDLPRTSIDQWLAGNPVDIKDISEGDLIFFSTKKKDEISHVGIYIGELKFIHAPREGKKMQIDSLATEYFQKRYMGARTYLR